MAHAFFPRTHRQGDIHFDYDESWTLGNHMGERDGCRRESSDLFSFNRRKTLFVVPPTGTDLLQVAAHEFGHVLGLQHSREPGAVMSAYYSFSYPLKLSEDDKQGIQYLYGAHPQVPPSPPPPPPPPSNPETNEIITSVSGCDDLM